MSALAEVVAFCVIAIGAGAAIAININPLLVAVVALAAFAVVAGLSRRAR